MSAFFMGFPFRSSLFIICLLIITQFLSFRNAVSCPSSTMVKSTRREILSMYCRYREVSPVCIGKHRPLDKNEMTKEHLIPKSLLRDPKFKAQWMITFHPSEALNVDISCHKCNNLKNQLADLPFVWKLQYLNKYNISLKNERSLKRTLDYQNTCGSGPVPKVRSLAIQCILRGDFEWINPQECIFLFHQSSVRMTDGKIVEINYNSQKLPRKLKKRSNEEGTQ